MASRRFRPDWVCGAALSGGAMARQPDGTVFMCPRGNMRRMVFENASVGTKGRAHASWLEMPLNQRCGLLAAEALSQVKVMEC